MALLSIPLSKAPLVISIKPKSSTTNPEGEMRLIPTIERARIKLGRIRIFVPLKRERIV